MKHDMLKEIAAEIETDIQIEENITPRKPGTKPILIWQCFICTLYQIFFIVVIIPLPKVAGHEFVQKFRISK